MCSFSNSISPFSRLIGNFSLSSYVTSKTIVTLPRHLRHFRTHIVRIWICIYTDADIQSIFVLLYFNFVYPYVIAYAMRAVGPHFKRARSLIRMCLYMIKWIIGKWSYGCMYRTFEHATKPVAVTTLRVNYQITTVRGGINELVGEHSYLHVMHPYTHYFTRCIISSPVIGRYTTDAWWYLLEGDDDEKVKVVTASLNIFRPRWDALIALRYQTILSWYISFRTKQK